MKVVQNNALRMRYVRELAEKKQRIEELTEKKWYNGNCIELGPSEFARVQAEHDANLEAQRALGGNPLGVDVDSPHAKLSSGWYKRTKDYQATMRQAREDAQG